ncbi:PACRG-like protein [Watersipora subatra]|uniref:PACRG-like protein n=1 Tax=Watersipora subatra TaxID=2589382 RepID=UPI00355C6735
MSMKKSSSAGSSRAGSGGTRSKPSSACSVGSDVKSSGVKSKPSSANSDSGRVSRPSDKLNPKTCDPFNDKKNVSAFVSVYSNGGLPCRLIHGSVKHKLAWNSPPEQTPFDPLLVTLAEGLKETMHPYSFVARQGFVELLSIPDAGPKALPVLSKVIGPIRTALNNADSKVFEAGLDALAALSAAVRESLNQHLKQFLVPLSKRLLDTQFRDNIIKVLQAIETNGGKEATGVIKSKIPTYNSIMVGYG